MDEKKIASLMKNLDCTREEAIECIMEDAKIDRMSDKEVKAEYTEEERKAIKEATKTGKKKTVYKFDRKAREKEPEKVNALKAIFDSIAKLFFNCKIVNEGQEITFTIGENEYSLVLTKHRKKKG